MTGSPESPQSGAESEPDQLQKPPQEPQRFGFKPVSEREGCGETADSQELAFDELLSQGPALGDLGPGGPSVRSDQDSPSQRRIEPGQESTVFERPQLSLERSWILALALGFFGTLIGGLLGVRGAPQLLGVAAVAPVWIRVIGGANTPSAALAAVAWTLGCFGAGAGLGAEGAAARFVAAVPFSSHYLAFLPLLDDSGAGSLWDSGAGSLWEWPSLIPGACFLVAISTLGRPFRGLGALLLASLPVAWIAARSARFCALALREDWDAGTALLVSVPPQHFLVLVGALVVAVASATPLGTKGLMPPRGTGRTVFWMGAGAALLGLLGEPLLAAVWRSYSAL